MIDLYQELAVVTAALQAAQVEYALCGALALAVYGAPRATKDLDFIVSRQDEARLRETVRGVGYLFEALPMEFSSGISVQRFSKLIDGRLLMLDVLWAEGPLGPIWARRERVAWRDGEISVVSCPDLITLKLTAGRPQDLVDIQSLSALEGRRGKS